jgi:hypothetical protein
MSAMSAEAVTGSISISVVDRHTISSMLKKDPTHLPRAYFYWPAMPAAGLITLERD